MQVQENKMSQYHGRAGAARAGGSDERWARTRVSEVKGSSTLGCLAAAADGGIGDSGGHSEWGKRQLGLVMSTAFPLHLDSGKR